MAVYFHYIQKKGKINNIREMKRIIKQLVVDQNKSLTRVDYIFCPDEYLLDINKKFLGQNSYTDTISFSLNKRGAPIIGEVYISMNRVRENAKEFKVSIKKETARVIFHSALHLCGFKDKTIRQNQIMRQLEDKYLQKYVSRETHINMDLNSMLF
ncbi:MAG: rRNA maturation RNase YbeY [Ginsengibacter sp.]